MFYINSTQRLYHKVTLYLYNSYKTPNDILIIYFQCTIIIQITLYQKKKNYNADNLIIVSLSKKIDYTF